MNKKIMVLAAAIMAVATTGAFAFGIGLQANGNAGDVFEPGIAVTFKTDSIPLIFAANWYFGDKKQSVGLTGDYWILNDKITTLGNESLNWFIGIGFFGNIAFEQDEDVALNGGLRVPIGLNMFLAKGVFEPFLQVAPSFGVQFVPSLAAEDLFFPISAGFRVWFK